MLARGQIHWVDFGGVVGRRPAIIVSNNRANQGHTVVIVAPITNTVPVNEYPSVLKLANLRNPGPITGCARFDNLQAVPRTKVEEYPVHTLGPDDLAEADRCLRDAVAL
jgi:mRNA-degrading endonuclease toxin of MazEF toxin-antitoxin module